MTDSDAIMRDVNRITDLAMVLPDAERRALLAVAERLSGAVDYDAPIDALDGAIRAIMK